MAWNRLPRDLGRLCIAGLLASAGCGPAVPSSTESDGASGSSGDASDSDDSASGASTPATTGSTTTDGSGSGGGSPGNPTDTSSVEPCELPVHESGSEQVIEVINGLGVPIVLAGDGCDQPLRLRTLEQDRVNWNPDCSWPICPEAIGGWACAVCDCGQVTILLQPGESTTFTWSGEDYGLIETDPVCEQCQSCWLSTRVPDGRYEAGIPYFEYCDGDDACGEPPMMHEYVVRFEYPEATVVIEITA
jgi:hypothetical protein